MSTDQHTLQRAKQKVLDFWSALDGAVADDSVSVCSQFLDAEFIWKGPHPIGTVAGPTKLAGAFFQPFKHAFQSLSRETHLFCAGHSSGRADGGSDGQLWVGATGYFRGITKLDFLGIPATDKEVRIRWTDFYRFEGDAIVECQCIIDFVDWFDQIGLHVLPTPKGVSHVFPAATGYDAVLTSPQAGDVGEETLALGRSFVFGGLNAFDENDLSSMGMAQFFHKNVKWFGPGGIGACLSLKEFEELHQQPWLIAFPDRKVQDLESLFAEDNLLAASGSAGVIATHTGPYQGVGPTGKRIEFSGIDFWVRDGDKFTENWVFVDFPHMFDQMGIDLFARMRERAAETGMGS